jgi:hypothetical protein
VGFQPEAPDCDGENVLKAAAKDPTLDAKVAGEGHTQADAQPEPTKAGDNRDGNEVSGSVVRSIYLVTCGFSKNFNLLVMGFA